MIRPGATAIVVAFRTDALDLAWVPDTTRVLVVHNDEILKPSAVAHPGAMHLGTGDNIGFGRAVNVALARVETERVVLINPDAALVPEHWAALSNGDDHELVVVPLLDPAGAPTTSVSPYPSPVSTMLTALRVGRLVPRGTRLRGVAMRLLGRWGTAHSASMSSSVQRWSAATHWACAAACSYPTKLMREVGGFDPGYFLYLEDVDLCSRMVASDPDLYISRPGITCGVHQVAASSASDAGRRRANLEQARSALRYAAGRPGWRWASVRPVLRVLCRWRARTDGGRTAVGGPEAGEVLGADG